MKTKIICASLLFVCIGCHEPTQLPAKEAKAKTVLGSSAILKKQKKRAAPRRAYDDSRAVWELEFSGDGSRIATSGKEGTHVWSASGEHLIELESSDPFCDVELSPDGARVLTGGGEEPVTLWSEATGDIIDPLSENPESEYFSNDVDFSPDGRWIAAADAKGFTAMLETKTGKERALFFQGEENVVRASFSLDSKRLITQSETRVMLWSVESHEEISSLFETGVYVFFVDYSKTKNTIEVLYEESEEVKFSLFDGSTGALQKTVVLPLGMTFASLSDDQRWLVAMSRCDGSGWVMDVSDFEKPTRIFKLRSPADYQFTPDEQSLLVGYRDGSMQKLSLKEKAIARTWQAHPNEFFMIKISPDQKQFATSGDDGAKLWSIETGELLSSLQLSNESEAEEMPILTAQR